MHRSMLRFKYSKVKQPKLFFKLSTDLESLTKTGSLFQKFITRLGNEVCFSLCLSPGLIIKNKKTFDRCKLNKGV